MKKRVCAVVLAAVILALVLCACETVWGGDNRSDNPTYHYSPIGGVTSGEAASGVSDTLSGTPAVGEQEGEAALCTFVLELRQPTDRTEVSEGDTYPHSTIDGELIVSWEIPMYGNTVYESVEQYFKDKSESITFRLSQHRYYMFHEYVTQDGETYNLETVYIAADGEYAYCANFQSVLGDDGVAGTGDDLKVLTLVYKGWLY